MRITVSNVLTVSAPSAELVRWCEENLALPNPDYTKKLRMGLWLGKTPKFLYLYEINGKNLILPFGTLSAVREKFPNTEFESGFAPYKAVDFGADIPLYDYQKTAVEAMLAAKYGILQSPAGSGKTQMGLALAAAIGKRTLWLCHTLDLVKQSRERAELYIKKDLIGTISEGKVNIGEGITFATVQTMCKLDLPRYKDCWDVIIVDECHRAAGTPTAVTRYQKVLGNLSARHKYGLSATVHRADGMIKATRALLGSVAYSVPEKAVADKIMRVSVLPVKTGVGMSREAMNTDGTINYAKLIDYLTGVTARNALIAGAVSLDRKPSLILSERLGHLERLMNLLPEDMRGEAVMISGKMTSKTGKAEREKAIEDMRSGAKKYLFATYSLAKEGLDIPCLERLYLATPQKDYAVVTQSIGRIARADKGKADPVVYDFVDCISYLENTYKKRCGIYKKNHCCFIESEVNKNV